MSQKDYDLEPRWYVVHTYSGYENKVKTDLEKMIKNRELQDYFFDIIVPMEEQIEIKDGKRKTNLKKVIWPKGRQLFENTVVVISMVVVVSVLIFVLDLVFRGIKDIEVKQLNKVVASNTVNATNSNLVNNAITNITATNTTGVEATTKTQASN